MFWLSLGFGALGIAANVLIYQQKNGKKLLEWKLISDVLWLLQYLMISAYSGVAVACIALVREVVFLVERKQGKSHKIWLAVFWCCGALSAVLTWKNPFSLLPALASMLSIFSFWRNNPRLSRFLAIPISCCMMTYDISCGSVMGIVNESLTLTSSFYGMYRLRQSKVSADPDKEAKRHDNSNSNRK